MEKHGCHLAEISLTNVEVHDRERSMNAQWTSILSIRYWRSNRTLIERSKAAQLWTLNVLEPFWALNWTFLCCLGKWVHLKHKSNNYISIGTIYSSSACVGRVVHRWTTYHSNSSPWCFNFAIVVFGILAKTWIAKRAVDMVSGGIITLIEFFKLYQDTNRQ